MGLSCGFAPTSLKGLFVNSWNFGSGQELNAQVKLRVTGGQT